MVYGKLSSKHKSGSVLEKINLLHHTNRMRNIHQQTEQQISNLKIYHDKIVPFVDFYKKQISSYNCTEHKILTNEISLILPNFPKDRKEKRSIIASLVTGFIGLVYEGISSYLHNKRQKTLHKAFMAMENKENLQCNKIILL